MERISLHQKQAILASLALLSQSLRDGTVIPGKDAVGSLLNDAGKLAGLSPKSLEDLAHLVQNHDTTEHDFSVLADDLGIPYSRGIDGNNTYIEYFVLDAIGARQYNEVILKGTLSVTDMYQIAECLDAGQFNPTQVGLQSMTRSVDDDSFIAGGDHNMHNFCSITRTKSEPTVEMSCSDLLQAFQKAAAAGWIEDGNASTGTITGERRLPTLAERDRLFSAGLVMDYAQYADALDRPTNTVLTYRYVSADAATTPSHSVFFHGVPSVDQLIAFINTLDHDEFNPQQVGLPSLAIPPSDPHFDRDMDTSMHQLSSMTFTSTEADSDFSELLSQFQAASNAGWKVFQN